MQESGSGRWIQLKKNKTAELFLVLLILIVMSVGILILQNGMEKLQNVKPEIMLIKLEVKPAQMWLTL